MKRQSVLSKPALPAVFLAILFLGAALAWVPRVHNGMLAATALAEEQAQPGPPGKNVTQGTDGLGALLPPEGAKPQPEKIELPAGFSIAVWADNVKGARTMSLASDGTVFVGTWQVGSVYALADR